MEFFTTSTRNILKYAAAAGVRHYVALSVVGTERIPDSPYLRAKNAQETLIKGGGIPDLDRSRDAVLRVRQAHRRRSHGRDDGAVAARTHSADGG